MNRQNDFYQGALDECYNYLAHFGKGHLTGGHSGRYPWGSGARPMQSEGGPKGGPALLEKRKGLVKTVGSRVTNQVSSNVKKSIPVVGKVKKDEPQETKDQMKKRLLDRGNPKEVLNNADLFTTQELNDYLNRLSAVNRLQGAIPKKKGFRQFLNETTSTINTLVNMYDAGKKVWDRAKPQLEKAGIIEKKEEPETFGKELAKEYLSMIQEAYKNAPEGDKLSTVNSGDLAKYAAAVKAIENLESSSRRKQQNN